MKASPEPGSLAERLAHSIERAGPISVGQYMAEANAHYYAGRDPFGAAGDFVTAPEVSQMFGELVGLWLADLWDGAGRPEGASYVELGPGRGTLAGDALRAMRKAGLDPAVHLVETSPRLREAQARRVPGAVWHDDLSTLPGEGPLLAVANEFFDALPIEQRVRDGAGWRELKVRHDRGRFVRETPPGPIHESSPASVAIARRLARSMNMQGGAALVVDYGHARTSPGDTLQAVARHEYADPWREPGERDLTAHVDFEALGEAARDEGVGVFGPVAQGEWLRAMGIDRRAAALAGAAPARAGEIEAARHRLVAPEDMGDLFKVMALAAPGWPDPAGFA
jgi:NADH dehydrogenase [ubiquinone] 1 alpha subcomplex assembly factor 7